MTIRNRLTLWYCGMLLASLVFMEAVMNYELVYENRLDRVQGQGEPIRKQMAEIILYYGVPTLGLLVVGGWFVLRRTLSPLRLLTERAERVQAETLNDPLPRSYNGDEIDRLTGVFNEMLGRLDQSFSRIREFTLHASHELKTPLTILHGGLETMAREKGTQPNDREALEAMMDEVQRMARIVDDLTLLTKAGVGQTPLAREAVQLDELVREACEDARMLGEPEGVTVELRQCESVPATGDRHRLRQLWLILADNAVKHNESKGRVDVALRKTEDGAEVRFENTGPGFDPTEVTHVFDPFFRGTDARRLRREGCGLGLSIARWIVEAHGGRITAESRRGGPTVISVFLPSMGPASTQGV